MEQDRIVLVAGLLFVLAVGIFVLWGPTNLIRKRRKGQVGGLVNLGNSCFLNTLLQAFAACPNVVDWLVKQDLSCALIQALLTTLKVLNGEHHTIMDDPFAPVDVLNCLKYQWNIPPGEQDAHEMFIIILSAIEKSLQQSGSWVCSLSNALDGDSREAHLGSAVECIGTKLAEQYVLPTITASTARIPLPKENASPFQGLITSSLQCTKCNFKNVVRCDKFDSLSLPLPAEKLHRHTLMELLNNFIATETVHMDCENCKLSQVDVLKTSSFGKLPGCLCIHIVRTTWLPDSQASKRLDYVEFPEVLSMDNFTYGLKNRGENGHQKHLFELRAVVVHRGDLNQGHFVTYRRSKFSWLLTSDADVMECSKREVLGSSAYMLFYDKFSSKK